MKIKKVPIIYTERLSLHAISDNDTERVIDIVMNEEVAKTYMVPEYKTRDEAIPLFNTLKKLSLSEDRFVYGIYLTDELIGFINDVGIGDKEIELGYVIYPLYSGNGYATEALKASIKELFASEFNVVKAGAFEDNLASMRVMEKCQMKKTGQEEKIEYRGKEHRCIYYEIKA